MVRSRTVLVSLSCLVLAATLALLLGRAGWAQEWGEEESYLVQEEYRVQLNKVGDGHITDTLEYDPRWFEENVDIFEENPNLLSRRYRSDTNTGETENFDVDIDRRNSAIVISFDTPGLAYKLSDGWHLFGFGDYQLVEESDERVVLEAQWTFNGEFTLFQDMSLEEKVIVELPEGASGAEFDEDTGAVRYDLPAPVSRAGNLLSRNRAAFAPLFAALSLLALAFLLFSLTRKAQRAPATAGAASPPDSSPSRPVPTPQQTGLSDEVREAPEAVRYCRKCGHPRARPEERYCRCCGAAFE